MYNTSILNEGLPVCMCARASAFLHTIFTKCIRQNNIHSLWYAQVRERDEKKKITQPHTKTIYEMIINNVNAAT